MSLLPKLTTNELLKYSASQYANNVAHSTVDNKQVTFAQFSEKVYTIAEYLKSLGIEKGDKVAILGENSSNWGVAYFAITNFGAIAVPIMQEFHENEVHHIMRHSESKAIFVSAKYFHKIEDLDNENIKVKILLDDLTIVPPESRSETIREVITAGLKEYRKVKDVALKAMGMRSDEPDEDDSLALIYTSGTTGHSKGVILTHKNVVFDAISTLDIVQVSETDKMLSILPLAHTYECTLGLILPFTIGSSVYYLDKPPTATVLIPAMKKVKPTVMLSVPLVIEKIYRNKILPEIRKKKLVKNLYGIGLLRKKINKAAGKKLIQTFGGNLRIFCIGGAPLATDVEKFLREAKFPYAIGYGLTETSPLVIGCAPDVTKLKSTGFPLPGVDVKLDNVDPKTGEGEILIKGPMVMKEYYKDPEQTKEVITKDGWFRTGDLGYKAKDGHHYIKGRIKNVILGANGKNIYPEEIEAIINEQPFVSESIVIDREGKLIAKVYLNYDYIDSEHQIVSKSETESRKIVENIIDNVYKGTNERLPVYARISKIYEQVEPFEKTPTNKVKRYLYI